MKLIQLNNSIKNKHLDEKPNALIELILACKNMSKSRKIFYAITFSANIVSLFVAFFLVNQAVLEIVVSILIIVNIISTIIFNIFVSRKAITYLHIICILFITLGIFFLSTQFIPLYQIKQSGLLNSEIRNIKNNCEKIVSTDNADVYVNIDTLTVYTVSNIDGSKYINESNCVLSENSELYYLYNVGMEFDTDCNAISNTYLYPPSPYTITSYEYLLEFDCNNKKYVSKVFIPGIVDFGLNLSSKLLVFSYKDSETVYNVFKIDNYLLFASEYSTFSTPFQNVSYDEKEYFYVRYNRFLRQYLEHSEFEEIGENNVKFIKSLLVLSPTIEKVNMFWIGESNESSFVGTTPVIEIVYMNGTSDIAIVKDIMLNNVEMIVGYR